jgi:hypothetical protein
MRIREWALGREGQNAEAIARIPHDPPLLVAKRIAEATINKTPDSSLASYVSETCLSTSLSWWGHLCFGAEVFEHLEP